MYSQKLWLMVIVSTLLLQCCIADDALSTVKTSSGRSLYSNIDSKNSNVEITPDSFSKSDSTFSASQSEISQNESSMVNTSSGTSLQNSSFYSSNSNVSDSNSNTVVDDGFISQTDSNFETLSSSTTESDTFITTTPNSPVMSSTSSSSSSSSSSTTSSSTVISNSINGQLLDSGEVDISLPNNFPPFNPSYETKSLDSIPDFDDDSLELNTRLGSPASKFPYSLGLKPFMDSFNPNLSPNFPKFPNFSAPNQFKNFRPKIPYSPAGTFNSKPPAKIGTPMKSTGMSNSFLPGSNPFTSPNISKSFSSLSDTSMNSPLESLPIDLLPSNELQNDNLSLSNPLQQPPQSLAIDNETLQLYGSNSITEDLLPNDISLPESLQPGSDLPTPLGDQLILGSISSENVDSTSISQNLNLETNQYPFPDLITDYESSDLTNPMNSDEIFNSPIQPLSASTEFPPDTSSYGLEFSDSPIDLQPSYPYDLMPKSSETDIPIEFHSHSDEYPDGYQNDKQSQFQEPLDSPINPHSLPVNENTLSLLDDSVKDWNPSRYPFTPKPSISSIEQPTNLEIPTVLDSSTDSATISSPNDSTLDHSYDADSPFLELSSQQPYDILKNLPPYGEDLTTPKTPYNLYEQPELPSMTDLDSPLTLESMDTNQGGFISPEEILESYNPTLPKTSPIGTIPDTPYLLPTGYDDKEHLSPGQFLPHDELSLSLEEQSIPQPSYQKYNDPENPKSLYDQFPGPKETFKPKSASLYSGFNQPSLYYPWDGYAPFANNHFPIPRVSNFRKYPSYLPYGDDTLKYPPISFSSLYRSPYCPPGMPSPYDYPRINPLLYDYPRNFVSPLSLLNQPSKPDFYNISPPFLPRNSFFKNPSYAKRSLFDSPKRPPYMPKDWSKISTSRGSPLSPDLPPTQFTADLDSMPSNQPLSDSPTDSFLPQSEYDSSILDLPIVQPSFSPNLNNDLSSITSLSESLPLIDSLATVPDSPLSPTPFNLNEDSPYETTDSLPINLNSNQPSVTLDIPKDLLTPKSIDDEIFDILKQQYESTTAEYRLSNSIYPRDIAPNFGVLTDAELTYNFVILGSSPAALASLKTLSDTGKSVLLIERGDLPPHISKSLYYRPKLLQSDYVRKIKSSAPHCNVETIIYAPNVLGEESTYDSNVWDYGVRSKYIKWGKLSKKWTWNNVKQYFTDSCGQPDTCTIPVSKEIENTKAVDTLTSILNDAGLYRIAYDKDKRSEGLTMIPFLQENGENIILAEKTFQQLTSCNNIQLALNTIPESIIFDSVGKAIGVVVKTPCGGTKTINIVDELIIGTNPIDVVKFLHQSGIGDHERLEALNIPTQINLPYVGKELIISPLYFGVLYLFPQGTLLCNDESDFTGKDYLFGRYRLPSALAVDYLKAALNIYESREANIVFNFRAFSKSMSEKLNSFSQRLSHIDEKIKDFLSNLCEEYDLLLPVPQLTNVLSRGEILIDYSSGQFEALVDTGMYRSKRDITIMQKALKVLKSIAETETFKALNGKVVQIPVEQCGQPDFSTEYNRCSIRYLSLPNLHYYGGTIMGVSPSTSVVNEDLLLHGSLNVRIFSQSVVPYGMSTDSGAVGNMIGNLGAHVISQKYLS